MSNTSPKAQIKLPPFHRLALIFPPLTDREYRNLVDNIAAQGLISHHYTVAGGQLDVVSVPFR